MHAALVIYLLSVSLQATGADPLDDYVHRPDPAYRWEVISHNRSEAGVSTYVINMTSQTWKDRSLMDRPVWWHYLTVHVPDVISDVCREHAYVVISTGRNTERPPASRPRWRGHIAHTLNMTSQLGCITATLRQVPNQPMTFMFDTPETANRREDGIIALTWLLFIQNTSDPEVLLRFPMTKAVVRAFDTINTFVGQQRPGYNISKFIPAGESKRGWTTWMVMATDPRVVAAQPSTMSAINFKETVKLYYRALGGWSFALHNYWNHNLTRHLYGPELPQLLRHVDPYTYRHRYNMPYMMMKAASDEFFTIWDSWTYWSNMPQRQKFIWIVEKIGHFIRGMVPEYWYNQGTFYLCVVSGYQWPQMTWNRTTNATHGGLRVRVDRPPKRVTVWSALSAYNSTDILADTNDTQATNKRRRDFRVRRVYPDLSIDTNHMDWQEGPVTSHGGNEFSVVLENPRQRDGLMWGRWLAFFIKMVFEAPGGRELTLTTEANVIPNTWPWPECKDDPASDGCQGVLV